MIRALFVLFAVIFVAAAVSARTSSRAMRDAWSYSLAALALLMTTTDMAWRIGHGIPSPMIRRWGDQGFPFYDSPVQGAAIAVGTFALGVLCVCRALWRLAQARTDGSGEERWLAVAWVTIATWVVVRVAYAVAVMIHGEPVTAWHGSIPPDSDSTWQALTQLATCLVLAGFFYYIAEQLLRRRPLRHHR